MNFLWLLLPLAYQLSRFFSSLATSSFMAFYFDIDDRLKLVDSNKCGFLLNIAYVYVHGRL